MANQDSSLELASESLSQRQARYSSKLLSSHVGWVVSTYLFFLRQLDIFHRVRLIIDDVLKVGASTYPTWLTQLYGARYVGSIPWQGYFHLDQEDR